MADSKEWKLAKLVGGIGEATVFPLLTMPVWCWRTAKGACKRWQQAEYKAQEGKVDADVVISFDACEGCPMLEDGAAAAGKQLHEIKTNVAAYDITITEGRANRTQNLYIELVQNEKAYLENKMVSEIDPLEGGKRIKYRKGIGWWRKREYAYEHGMTRHDKAHWYHFYQPLDIWERIKAAKDEDGNLLYPHLERPIGGEAQFTRATDEEIQEWLDDWFIDDNAILITQIPVEICISVPRGVLKRLVYNIECWGEPRHYDSYGNFVYDKSKYVYYNEGKGELRAYKIPIKDVIPCINMGKINRGAEFETQGQKGVLVSLIGEYVTKKGKGHRIKGVIPDLSTIGYEAYTPARLAGEMGADGAIRVNVNAFKNPYDKTGAVWVPRIIWEFDNLKLKKYPYEY